MRRQICRTAKVWLERPPVAVETGLVSILCSRECGGCRAHRAALACCFGHCVPISWAHVGNVARSEPKPKQQQYDRTVPQPLLPVLATRVNEASHLLGPYHLARFYGRRGTEAVRKVSIRPPLAVRGPDPVDRLHSLQGIANRHGALRRSFLHERADSRESDPG